MGRTTKILGACAAALAFAGSALWWHWTGKPEYSLMRIASAVTTHDVAEFQRLVDLSSVAGRAVDDFMGEEESGLAQGLNQMVKPLLVQGITDAIKKEVERGTAITPTDNNRVQQVLQRFPGAGNFLGIKYVKREGKIAHVGINTRVPRLGFEQTLDVMLREMDHYWQVAEISNLKQYLAETAKVESEMLAAINDERKFQLLQVQKESFPEDPDDPKHLGAFVSIHAQIRNDYATATGVRGTVFVFSGGKELIRLALNTTKPWEKGETREWEWYPSIRDIEERITLFNTPSPSLRAVFIVGALERPDGVTLSLPSDPLEPKAEPSYDSIAAAH